LAQFPYLLFPCTFDDVRITPLAIENNIKKSNIKMKKEKIQCKNQKWVAQPTLSGRGKLHLQ